MFIGKLLSRGRKSSRKVTPLQSVFCGIEGLEDRCLLSATPAFGRWDHGSHGNHLTTTTFSDLQTSNVAAYNELNTIASAEGLTISSTQNVLAQTVNSTTTDYSVNLSMGGHQRLTLTVDENGNPVVPTNGQTTLGELQLVNSAAYNELNSLASADGVMLAATQSVSVETLNANQTFYSVRISPSTGNRITLTSDQSGTAVAPPSHSTTTMGDLQTSDPAAYGELMTLASDEGLTAPVSTQTVNVLTANELTTYSINMGESSGHWRGMNLTVDAAGNPAGNEEAPFESLSGVIQNGLNALATADGQTALSSTSTQNVRVATSGDEVTYTLRLSGTGQTLELTVDETGAPATPVRSRLRFGRYGFGGHHMVFGGHGEGFMF